jgi:hypothetical protein
MRYLLILLVACSKPAAVAPPAELAGLVHCDTPVAIQVSVTGAITQTITADTTGHYRFSALPVGHYVVSATAPSMRETEADVGVDLAAGAQVSAPDLTLTPAGTVTGRITISGQSSGNGGITVTLDGTDLAVATDDSGAFALSRVAVGTYRLQAQKIAVGGRSLRNLVVAYAHTSDIGTLDITPGISADFNHPPGFTVTAIGATPYCVQPGSTPVPLPLNLPAGEVARYDTVVLSAPSQDPDGDAITYFWTVTAGTLDRTDQDTVSWTVDSQAAASATVAVRIVDERSASNQLTTQMSIVDAQALSADATDTDVVYAYRVFSSDFHILQLDFASGAVSDLAQVSSLSDPTPQHVGDFIHIVTDADGSPHHFFFRPGDAPSERSPGGNERGLSAGGLLVQSQGGGATVGWGYDPASDSARQLFTCGSAGCGSVAGARGSVAAFVERDVTNTINLFDVASGALLTSSAPGDVGDTLLVSPGSVIYSDVAPGNGRTARNNVDQLIVGAGTSTQLYAGLYDVFVGGYDGDLFGFTEQPYREVYAPETAFLFRRSTLTKSSVDTADAVANVFAYDEIPGIASGRVILRRYPRADWLRDANLTHYQLVQEPAP